MSLFPLISQPDIGALTATEGLPLYREVDWDFRTNKPVWKGGNPVYVTGARAVLVWAWNALHTERYAHVTPKKLFDEFGRFLSFTENLTLTL